VVCVGWFVSKVVSKVAGRRGMNFCRALPVAAVATAALAACSNTNQRTQSWQPTNIEQTGSVRPTQPITDTHPRPTPVAYAPEGSVPRIKGVYKVGKPYSINGVMYVPAEEPGYDRVGIASWYGTDFHAKQTANGEVFDMGRITAAHPTLPLPSYVHVTNLRNGRTLLVRVNDRGPYKPGRIIDLSMQTATLLGFEGQGTTEIRVRYAGPAPLDPSDDKRERQHLAGQPWNRMVSNLQRPWFGLGMRSAP
jgi:rare lipoprotein A (peptidoglycan hydrolase)